MFLASRISGYPVISGIQVASDSTETVLVGAPHATTSNEALEQKLAVVEHINAEAVKISGLSLRMTGMDLTNVARVDLTGLRTLAERLRRDLASSIENRPLFATQR